MEPARVRYQTGKELVLGRTVVKGEGARSRARPRSRASTARGAAPQGRVALELVRASTGGLAPVNARLQATATPTHGSVHLSADMPSAAAHLQLDAEVPLESRRRGPPRLAARGAANVHLSTNQVQLQALPFVPRALARQGDHRRNVASLDLTMTGDDRAPRGALSPSISRT